MELIYHSESGLPLRRATVGSNGWDLPTHAVSYTADGPVIHTGIRIEIPEGHVGLLAPRSSAGAKLGLELKNTVGVIDSDYRGEIMARCAPVFDRPFKLEGYYLQLVIVASPDMSAKMVDDVHFLGATERGDGGFGSTGGL